MNVGSILNGDSPTEDPKLDQQDEQIRRPHPVVQKHSINNLLNDSPSVAQTPLNVASASGKEISKDEQEEEEDVDSAAEMIDRELEIQFQMEEEEKQKMKKDPEIKKESTKHEVKPVSTYEKKSEAAKHEKQLLLVPKLPKVDSNHQSQSLVLKDLNRLNELKKNKWKPKRYLEPPIWAQQYVSASQKDKLPFNYQKQAPSSSQSNKPVFDRGSMHSTDLECLVTGVIPPQSTVRMIAEWIYANFVDILVENRQYVELELKFGTIVDKTSGSRIAIGVSSECIYTDTSAIRFELSVHEAGWKEMKAFMDELEKQYQEENRRDPTKPRKKFATTETDNVDFFYTHAERNERPQRIRITKDQLLNPPRYAGIEKKRLADIHVFNPSSMFDFRISLSVEIPIAEGSIEPIMKKNKIALQRGKKRISYTHSPTVTKFDFTEVSIPKPTRNKAGKTVISNEVSHELELELDTFLIFRGFDKVRDGLDSIRFEELVEVFLNNARCCNNRVTKFASK